MSPEEIAKRLELFKKEWADLVPAARYSIIFSIIFILIIWLEKVLDLSFFKSIYNFSFTPSLENVYFAMANLIIFAIFILVLLDRGYVNLKILYYKWRYPLKRLNKDFYIVSFQGRVCLLDIKKKEIKWIKSFKTALDLDFIGEWTSIDKDITLPSSLVNTTFLTKDGENINLRDFKYVDGIHTQADPGT